MNSRSLEHTPMKKPPKTTEFGISSHSSFELTFCSLTNQNWSRKLMFLIMVGIVGASKMADGPLHFLQSRWKILKKNDNLALTQTFQFYTFVSTYHGNTSKLMKSVTVPISEYHLKHFNFISVILVRRKIDFTGWALNVQSHSHKRRFK